MSVAHSPPHRFGNANPGPPGTSGFVAIVLFILVLVFTLLTFRI